MKFYYYISILLVLATTVFSSCATIDQQVKETTVGEGEYVKLQNIHTIAILPLNYFEEHQVDSAWYMILKKGVTDSLYNKIQGPLINDLKNRNIKWGLDTSALLDTSSLVSEAEIIRSPLISEREYSDIRSIDTSTFFMDIYSNVKKSILFTLSYEYGDSNINHLPPSIIESKIISRLSNRRSYIEERWLEKKAIDSISERIEPIIADVLLKKYNVTVIPVAKTRAKIDSIVHSQLSDIQNAEDTFFVNKKIVGALCMGTDALVYGEISRAVIFSARSNKNIFDKEKSNNFLSFTIIDKNGTTIMRKKYCYIGKPKKPFTYYNGINMKLVRESIYKMLDTAFGNPSTIK